MSSVRIEFFEEIAELSLPLIRLTKSRNKITGTATFIFIRPMLFELTNKTIFPFQQMSLIWGEKKIKTNDLTVLFYKGQPFLIKSIFIFKNSKEWFEFLNFMNYYSKEMGLSFTRQTTNSFI
jgi:photosystem II protein